MKMPTIVGIFIFISRENFMLSRIEHLKSFITLPPGKNEPGQNISYKTARVQSLRRAVSRQGVKASTYKQQRL